MQSCSAGLRNFFDLDLLATSGAHFRQPDHSTWIDALLEAMGRKPVTLTFELIKQGVIVFNKMRPHVGMMV